MTPTNPANVLLWNQAMISGFDTETTGLSPWLDRIVEMGVLTIQNQGEVAAHRALCNPGVPIPASASAVHNITDKMVAGLPSWIRSPEVEVALDLLARSDVVCCANVDYDLGMLRGELWRAGMGPGGLDRPLWVDSLMLAKWVLNVPRFTKGYGLAEAARDMGVHADAAHSALGDARTALRLLWAVRKRKGWTTISQLERGMADCWQHMQQSR